MINGDSSARLNPTRVCVRILVRVRDAEDAPYSPYFDGRSRLFCIYVEGSFRQAWTADDIFFGAQFQRAVKPPTGTHVPCCDAAWRLTLWLLGVWLFFGVWCLAH